MTLLTSSLISPSTAKLLSYFSHNKLHAYPPTEAKAEAPTYVTIVMRKDGTPTIQNQSTVVPKSGERSAKQRKMILSHFLPRLGSLNANPPRPVSSPSQTRTGRLQRLPYELVIHILGYLDYRTLLALSRTSQSMYRLAHQEHQGLWQTLFRHDFPLLAREETPSAYRLYKNHFELRKRWQQGHVKTRYLTGHEDSIYCLVWWGQHQIISGSRDRSIKCWDLNAAEPLQITKTHHEGSVLCLRMATDGSFLVSGSSDATCLVWSLPALEPQQRLRGHTGGVLDICLVQDHIVSSSRDNTIRVWHRSTGEEIRRLVGHAGPVNALAAQGAHVVSASGDTTVRLWDLASGQCLKTFHGHTRGLACVKLEGHFVYSGGQDNKLKVWDIRSGQCVASMAGHTDLIRTIDTCAGKVVTGSYDRTIKVWDAQSNRCLLSFQSGHSSWIFNCLLSTTKIISAGQDKKIMVLDFGHGLTLA
ncbi:WD40-repeat-containing domain protein [Sporodiniella umbellata]|nr:WD40-repeat-containing domain protein [Sporodiniella umbellata]